MGDVRATMLDALQTILFVDEEPESVTCGLAIREYVRGHHLFEDLGATDLWI